MAEKIEEFAPSWPGNHVGSRLLAGDQGGPIHRVLSNSSSLNANLMWSMSMDRTTITTALVSSALLIAVPGLATAQQSGQQQRSSQQFGQQQPSQQQGQQRFGQQQFGQQQFGQNQQLQGEGAPLYASPGELMEVQSRLAQLGLDPGPQDGQWGRQTQQALEQFQNQHGLSATGNLNFATLSALGIQVGHDGSAMAGMGGGMMQPQQRGMGMGMRGMGQQQFGNRLQQRRQQFGQQGQQFGQQQQQQFGQGQQLAGTGAQLYASPKEVQEVEQRLSQMGLNPGSVDGRWNDQTANALEQFQQQHGLSPTGNLNFSTLAALGVQIGQEQGQFLGIGEQPQGMGRQGQQQFGRSGQSGQQQMGLQGQQFGTQGRSGSQSGQQQNQSH